MVELDNYGKSDFNCNLYALLQSYAWSLIPAKVEEALEVVCDHEAIYTT